MTLPAAARPFVDFPALLRAHGFAISPDQTIGFIEAIGLLGPRDIRDIRRAAVAMLAIPKEREIEFDALFRAFFMGQVVAASAMTDEDEEIDAVEPTGAEESVDAEDEESEIGAEAATAERLSHRQFAAERTEDVLARIARLAPHRLPRRRSYRRRPSRHGDGLDMRRTLREAVRRDGEPLRLYRNRRSTRQRKLLVLIDVSGSMKERSESLVRLAHTLVQAADRIEVFTLGTRLTRVTPALAPSDPGRALARVGALVADFDGGTRIGEALQAFLAIPRFAGFARGAAVLVLSDGLERGNPDSMVDSVRRLSRLAWRLDWLSPLAGMPGYSPDTEALAAALPFITSLSDGSGSAAIADRVLSLARLT
ncbi:vWA domain-containing protein [Nisaea sp.]|uniref:vWA domain-containing protein n=1 Tax=Nisaea sp. TaxID=2024842 RepID=UPI003B51A9E1